MTRPLLDLYASGTFTFGVINLLCGGILGWVIRGCVRLRRAGVAALDSRLTASLQAEAQVDEQSDSYQQFKRGTNEVWR